MVGFDSDESHGTIRKTSAKKTNQKKTRIKFPQFVCVKTWCFTEKTIIF